MTTSASICVSHVKEEPIAVSSPLSNVAALSGGCRWPLLNTDGTALGSRSDGMADPLPLLGREEEPLSGL